MRSEKKHGMNPEADMERLKHKGRALGSGAPSSAGNFSTDRDAFVLMEHLKIGVCTLDGNNRTTYVSAAMAKMLAASAQDLMGASFLSFLHEDDRKAYQAYALDVDKGKKRGPVIRIHRSDGSWLRASVTMLSSADVDESGVTLTLAVQEVSEVQEIEESLRRDLDLAEGIIETAQAIILVLDPQGRIVRFNPFLEEISGYRLDDVMGGDWFTIFLPHYERERIEDVFQAALHNTRAHGTINAIRTKDGRERIIEWADQALKDAQGQVTGLLAVGKDITDQLRAQEALKEYSLHLEQTVRKRSKQLGEAQEKLLRQQKLAALGQMAGGVAHELRSPLGVISNATYYLHNYLKDSDEKVREYIDIIDDELQRAEKIISDLLGFSRVKQPDRTTVSVGGLVRGVLSQLPPQDDIRLSLNIPDDLPAWHVDSQQIEQVVRNLVINAYQAMEPSVMPPDAGAPHLILEGYADGEWASLAVRDNGCGISSEGMKRIFLPLFTTKDHGIGLGLVISKNLTEANGGSIEVVSAPGEGSTFILTLPTDTSIEG